MVQLVTCCTVSIISPISTSIVSCFFSKNKIISIRFILLWNIKSCFLELISNVFRVRLLIVEQIDFFLEIDLTVVQINFPLGNDFTVG